MRAGPGRAVAKVKLSRSRGARMRGRYIVERLRGFAAAAFLFAVSSGCKEEAPEVEGPRELTKRDIVSFERAVQELGIASLSLGEIKTFIGIKQEGVVSKLRRRGFTPAEFLEVAEAVYLARSAGDMALKLPRKKKMLARKLLSERFQPGKDKKLRERLFKETKDSGGSSSEVISTALRNAALLEAHKKERKNKSAELERGKTRGKYRLGESPRR